MIAECGLCDRSWWPLHKDSQFNCVLFVTKKGKILHLLQYSEIWLVVRAGTPHLCTITFKRNIMKTITLILTALLFTFASLAGNNTGEKTKANPVKPDGSPLLKAKQLEKINHLLTFTAVRNSGSTYLNWHVNGEADDCVYVIERSMNGAAYELVGLKEGFGTPVTAIFLYSWVDRASYTGTGAYYRVKRVDKEGKTGYTEPVYIDYLKQKGDEVLVNLKR